MVPTGLHAPGIRCKHTRIWMNASSGRSEPVQTKAHPCVTLPNLPRRWSEMDGLKLRTSDGIINFTRGKWIRASLVIFAECFQQWPIIFAQPPDAMRNYPTRGIAEQPRIAR